MKAPLYAGQAEDEAHLAERIARQFGRVAREYRSPSEAMANAFGSVLGRDFEPLGAVDHRLTGMAWFRVFKAWGTGGAL